MVFRNFNNWLKYIYNANQRELINEYMISNSDIEKELIINMLTDKGWMFNG